MNAHFFNKMLFGFGLIGAGILFLLSKAGVIEFSIGTLFSTFWPVLIIYGGLVGAVIHARHHRHRSFGALLWHLVMIGAGTVLLLNNLGVTDISFHDAIQYLLPVLLILFGVAMLLRPSRTDHSERREQAREERRYWKEEKKRMKQEWKDAHHQHHQTVHDNYANDYIHTVWSKNMQHRSGFIGDVYLGQDYWELTSMNISHFIGDTVIDLTKASIPYGVTTLNVGIFIGDVKLYVPNDYDVEVSVTASSFIGDMNVLERREGGLMRSISTASPNYEDAGKKIRLIVGMFIGDVLVKRVG